MPGSLFEGESSSHLTRELYSVTLGRGRLSEGLTPMSGEVATGDIWATVARAACYLAPNTCSRRPTLGRTILRFIVPRGLHFAIGQSQIRK